jgi:LDH2 family malate/lactate/ureidoglycolate dehydrogenase
MATDVLSKDAGIEFFAAVIQRAEVPELRARRWAELLIESSLMGLDSHGIRLVPQYLRHIDGGGLDTSVEAEVVASRGACVTLDARGGIGHLAADLAVGMGLENAREHGIACISCRNANHIGACGLYVRQIATQNCIGVMTTVSNAMMAPWGGKTRAVGNNPIAIGAPIFGKAPFVYDGAMTVAAMERIRGAQAAGENIPPGWALDEKGQPSVDPVAALRGTLLPIGGHKGVGLAMGMEVLSAMLSGGASSAEVLSFVDQTSRPTGASYCLIVVNPAAFADPQDFEYRMSRWIGYITSRPTRPGTERVYYPGEIEGQVLHQRSQDGIPLSQRDRIMLTELAKRFGVPLPDTSRE